MNNVVRKIFLVCLAITSTLLVINGLVHVPFYLMGEDSTFTGLRMITLAGAAFGLTGFWFSIKKLNQPTIVTS